MDITDKTNKQLIDELEIVKSQLAALKHEHHRAEETLRLLKKNTERYLDLAEVILVALDEQAKVTMVAGRCFEMLGFKPEELIGKNWFDTCLSPEEAQDVYAVYKNLIAGNLQNVEYYENDVLTKYKKRIHVSWHNSLLTDDNGKIIGTLSAGTDITERKKVEEVLRQNEQQFRNIIDASPVPYALNDEYQHITYLNPAFTKTFGYDHKDIPVLDSWWKKAYPDPEYREWVKSTWIARLDQAKKNKLPFEPLEVNIQCKDGSQRTVLATAANLMETMQGNHLVILYDITDRKQAEHAVRDSERKYRLLFENMTSGFALHEIICDEQGRPENYRYLELNPAFEKLTGVPATVLLGKTIKDVMPDTEDYWIQTFGRVALTGESIAYENFSRELGRYYDTWVFSPQKNQFAVIFSDVTERKIAEEKVLEGDKQFQVLFAQSSFGVAKTNSITGEFVKINQRFCDLLGYTVQEMLKTDFKQITYPEDLPSDLENMDQLRAGKIDQIKKEKRYIHKDGSIVWANLSVLPLWEKNASPDFHLSIVEDITERKVAEEKLQRQKDEQQQILNTMLDAIISIDEQARILTFSKSAEKMFGYEAGEVLYKNIKMLMPDNYAQMHDNHLSNFLSTGRSQIIGFTRDMAGKRKNGEIFPLRLSVAELPGSNEGLRRFIGSCQDVTVLLQQEEQIRRTQKMDALGKLTGGIAHDYNNMLGVILGYAQVLQDEVRDNPRLLKLANDIHSASERGTNLSRKLLAFTRKKEPEAVVVDLNENLLGEKDLLQKTITPRISLKMDLEKNIWPVYLDSGDFEDAILNLSINAMHAMEKGGELNISTRNLQVTESIEASRGLKAGEYVEITVADNGTGMDRETRNKIFDPFFTTKGDQGVGLGLSMVYGFVKRSGGDIEVETSPGKGSSFILTLPRYTGTLQKVKTAESLQPDSSRGNESILVVDDEPTMVRLMENTLVPRGYTFFGTTSSEEALQILENESIDLMISDVIMPGMDGFRLASLARSRYPDLKIQLMSGYTDDLDKNAPDSDLSINLLHKPFSTQTLLRRVRYILDEKAMSSRNGNSRIMVMDDNEDMRDLFKYHLGKLGYDVVLVSEGKEALERYRQSMDESHGIAAVIIDLKIHGGMGGIETAAELRAIDPAVRLIVASGDTYSPIMKNCAEHGFHGAINKNFDLEEMRRVISTTLTGN